MPQIRRWGKAYVDRRNWREYNESLVGRGEVLLDFDVLDEWEDELRRMNQSREGKKEGCKIPIPGTVHEAPRIPSCPIPPPVQAGGGFRQVSIYPGTWMDGLKAPDWSTIWERTSGLDMELDGVRTAEPISIAIDRLFGDQGLELRRLDG